MKFEETAFGTLKFEIEKIPEEISAQALYINRKIANRFLAFGNPRWPGRGRPRRAAASERPARVGLRQPQPVARRGRAAEEKEERTTEETRRCGGILIILVVLIILVFVRFGTRGQEEEEEKAGGEGEEEEEEKEEPEVKRSPA